VDIMVSTEYQLLHINLFSGMPGNVPGL